MPMTVRLAGVDALSSLGTPAQTGHIRLRARFIQEDQPGRVEADLPPPPCPPGLGDVWTVLFAGAECLFLYVSPSFAKA